MTFKVQGNENGFIPMNVLKVGTHDKICIIRLVL